MLNRLKIRSTSKSTSCIAFGFRSRRDLTIEYIAFRGFKIILTKDLCGLCVDVFRIPYCDNFMHFVFGNRVTFIGIVQLKSP